MKLRDFLLLTTLISFGLIEMTTNAKSVMAAALFDSEERDKESSPPLAPSPLVLEDRVLGTAYYDTLSILSASNECSDFFGGPEASVDVFNQLMAQVRKDHDVNSVAMRMWGETVNVFNSTTRREYRRFEKVAINTNGAFYRQRFANSEPSIPTIGTFDPNTREVRVLILLHELAHLLKGITGDWLIPDDGKDSGQSRANSLKIEGVCKVQLRSLGKADPSSALAMQKKFNQVTASISPRQP